MVQLVQYSIGYSKLIPRLFSFLKRQGRQWLGSEPDWQVVWGGGGRGCKIAAFYPPVIPVPTFFLWLLPICAKYMCYVILHIFPCLLPLPGTSFPTFCTPHTPFFPESHPQEGTSENKPIQTTVLIIGLRKNYSGISRILAVAVV